MGKCMKAHGSKLDNFWKSPVIEFNPDCIASVEKTVDRTNSPALHLISGAGYDAVYVSRVVPTSMFLFLAKMVRAITNWKMPSW